MSSGEEYRRRTSVEEILHVKALIERRLQLLMVEDDIMEELFDKETIEPIFTKIVWEKLEEDNKEYFSAYYARLMVMRNIRLLNSLFEKQNKDMLRMSPIAVASVPPNNSSTDGVEASVPLLAEFEGVVPQSTGVPTASEIDDLKRYMDRVLETVSIAVQDLRVVREESQETVQDLRAVREESQETEAAHNQAKLRKLVAAMDKLVDKAIASIPILEGQVELLKEKRELEAKEEEKQQAREQQASQGTSYLHHSSQSCQWEEDEDETGHQCCRGLAGE